MAKPSASSASVAVGALFNIAVWLAPESIIPAERRWIAFVVTVSLLLVACIWWVIAHWPHGAAAGISTGVTVSGSNVNGNVAGRDVHQNIYHPPAAPHSKRQETIARLVDLLDDGRHWIKVCENPSLQIYPGDSIEQWERHVIKYLTDRLGRTYAIRVREDEGIERKDFSHAKEEVRDDLWAIHVRCVRLAQFIEELARE